MSLFVCDFLFVKFFFIELHTQLKNTSSFFMFGKFISNFGIGNRLTGIQKLCFNIVLSCLVICAGVRRSQCVLPKCFVCFVVQLRDAFSVSMLSVVPECLSVRGKN